MKGKGNSIHKCLICDDEFKGSGQQFICMDKSCQIVKTLFIWWVDIPAHRDEKYNCILDGREPNRFWKRDERMYMRYKDVFLPSHVRYFIKPNKKEIKKRLQQVRAKLFLLEGVRDKERIFRALNTKLCNNQPLTFKTYSYEKSNGIFDA